MTEGHDRTDELTFIFDTYYLLRGTESHECRISTKRPSPRMKSAAAKVRVRMYVVRSERFLLLIPHPQ